MTPEIKASGRHWLLGVTLAFTGVALARLVAPGFEASSARALFAVTGQLTALGGLWVILLGIRRRLRRDRKSVV